MVALVSHSLGNIISKKKAGHRLTEAEPIPDLTRFMQPSTLGDIATYTFFAGGGLFFGGELGLLTGGMAANSTITRDPESKQRIEGAFRKFRAEVLRAEADMVEKGQKNPMSM